MSRRRLFVAVGVVAGLALTGWWGWRAYTAPRPPDLPLDAMEKPVADAVGPALQDVRKHPRRADAWGKLGMVLQANGYEDPAVECFAQAEKLDPTDARWAYLPAARVLADDRAKAIDLWRRAAARAKSPDRRAAALFRLTEAEIADGQADAAEADLKALAEIDPADDRVRFCRGLLAVLRDDPATARAQLPGLIDSPFARKRACALLAGLPGDPAGRQAYQARAAALPADAAWPDPFVREVLKMDVRRSARMTIVKELMDSGRQAEALEELRDLAARSPDAETFQGIGLAYLNLGRPDEAEAALVKAVELDPRVPQAQAMLATVRVEQGEAARRAGVAAAAADRFARALEAADRALATDPNYAVGHLARGRALRGLGRQDEALRALRRAAECGPEYPDTHLHLGECLAEAGQRSEGIEELKAAARLAPNDPRPKAALEKWQK